MRRPLAALPGSRLLRWAGWVLATLALFVINVGLPLHLSLDAHAHCAPSTACLVQPGSEAAVAAHETGSDCHTDHHAAHPADEHELTPWSKRCPVPSLDLVPLLGSFTLVVLAPLHAPVTIPGDVASPAIAPSPPAGPRAPPAV